MDVTDRSLAFLAYPFLSDRLCRSKDFADLHEMLNKWRHIAYAEIRDPGLYYRMLSKAEQILLGGGISRSDLASMHVRPVVHDPFSNEHDLRGE